MDEINIGDKFYEWVCVSDKPIVKSRKKYYKCKCSCGIVRYVLQSSLLEGKSKSCGCKSLFYRRQTNKEKYKSRNKYEVIDDYAKVYFPDSKDFFLIDAEDLEKILTSTWHRNLKRGGYVVANGTLRTSKFTQNRTIQLSRLVMNCFDKEMYVDHINHDVLDNRKKNLRICTAEQNAHNTRISRRNKSGHKGVWWDEKRHRYQAYVGNSGERKRKMFNVNTYGSKEKAYDKACLWVEQQSLLLHEEYSIYDN